MELSRRERVLRALTYQQVDRLPTQFNYTTSMGRSMAQHFGVDMADLPERLDNHLVRLDMTYEKRYSEDGKARFDWWGAGHDTQEEGYYIRVAPLHENPDLDAYDWPDPHDPNLLDDARVLREQVGDSAFVVPNIGWALFERAWSLRGMENVLLEIALDPGYVGELLDRIVDIRLVVIERYLELGVDGGYFGDDYGAQVSTLFSPDRWRQLIKPRLARLFAPFLDRGLPVMMHSDGDIAPIVAGPRGDRPDRAQPGPAGGRRPRVAAPAIRWPARLLRRRLYPDGAALRLARGGEGGRAQVRRRPRTEPHRPDAGAVAPHDVRRLDGEHRGAHGSDAGDLLSHGWRSAR